MFCGCDVFRWVLYTNKAVLQVVGVWKQSSSVCYLFYLAFYMFFACLQFVHSDAANWQRAESAPTNKCSQKPSTQSRINKITLIGLELCEWCMIVYEFECHTDCSTFMDVFIRTHIQWYMYVWKVHECTSVYVIAGVYTFAKFQTRVCVTAHVHLKNRVHTEKHSRSIYSRMAKTHRTEDTMAVHTMV